ncbi:GNAT family N-acetyltransferase [Vibrio sp. JC009]|uniref:GNAT family N-acetyltransferase n=1 Tax=Vibrio sp. JC009 TaxID=2912314 RepID=UPI0023B06455|nr:GNAT family N-acetyltransferase [Vibrio sp. JC009]WED22008.1 GNAT family N-acetyltransferase [Vibrio sp. JC009]
MDIGYYKLESDSQLFNKQVYNAKISRFIISDTTLHEYHEFESELYKKGVELLGLRIPQSDLKAINFFENHGYQYIEASYRPFLILKDIAHLNTQEKFLLKEANIGDSIRIAEAAGAIFSFGRYHQDPNVEDKLANIRYYNWVMNAFDNECQSILKCVSTKTDDILAFFIVEYPEPSECFLSLVGLMPNYIGKRLSKFVWGALLAYLKDCGVKKISTSISSHNTLVFNLYISLGFTFPEPEITLHKWF